MGHIKSREPRVIREGRNPYAVRGVVRTYAKVMRTDPRHVSELQETDVEVRQFGPKDYHVSADGTAIEEGVYKDLGAANVAFRKYVERKKREGWQVLNERQIRGTNESSS